MFRKKVKVVYNPTYTQEFTIAHEATPKQLEKTIWKQSFMIKGKRGADYMLSQDKKNPNLWQICPISHRSSCVVIDTKKQKIIFI